MMFVGLGVVVLALVAFVATRGGDDEPVDTPPRARATPDNRPSTTVKPRAGDPAGATPKTQDAGSPKRGKAERIKVLWRDAEKAEEDGQLKQALFWYQQIVQFAESGSKMATDAKKRAREIRDVIDKQGGGTQSSRRRYITRKMSEAMGEEFDLKREDLRRRTLLFDIAAVKAELERMKKGTREERAERTRIVAELERVDRISKLFGTIPTRAAGLTGDKIVWSNYDPEANIDLIVTGADQKGVHLQDESTEQRSVVKWVDILPAVRISFLEALRNRGSAEETAYLGYYAKLLDDIRAEQYFEFAKILDDGPTMRARLKELRLAD